MATLLRKISLCFETKYVSQDATDYGVDQLHRVEKKLTKKIEFWVFFYFEYATSIVLCTYFQITEGT